jgi:hypothetical protein
MLNELIYTRCGTGRDILKNGAPQPGEGFKAHSCSEALFKEGADLSFIRNIAAVSHPFKEPDFVEDAYLYYIPEKGGPLFENFHPIINSLGRPGNFISQIFSGELQDYPCELFGSAAWDAKEKGEEYYYGFKEKAPDFLPQRENPPKGNITFEKAGEFISQGRAEALKAAAAFVFQQFAAAPEDRKYLVIKDTTENIELWIAAIGYAFPVKIACSIPFATRMADVTATGGTSGNRYAVNTKGFSCPIGEEGSKKRLKVIIAGIDLRDRNIGDLKSMPAYPYCILDGTQKKVLFEAPDVSTNSYYSTITRFDQEHRELLSVISELKIPAISDLIFEACNVYNYLIKTPVNSWQTAEVVKHLAYIKENLNADYFFKDTLYEKIYSNIENFFKRDEASGYKLLDWLRENGGIEESLVRELITGIFINKLKRGSSELEASWKEIERQSFGAAAAGRLLEKPVLELFIEALSKSDRNLVLPILSIYRDCLKITWGGPVTEKDEILIAAFSRGIDMEDRDLLKSLLSAIFSGNTEGARNFIFFMAQKYEGDPKRSDFIWRFIPDVFLKNISETNIRSFCGTVIKRNFPKRVEDILVKGLESGIKPGLLCQIFRENYKDPGTDEGLKFFGRYIEKADDANTFSTIIDEMNASELHEQAGARLCNLIDKKIPILVKPRSPEVQLERKLRNYAKSTADCGNSLAGILLCDLGSYTGDKEKINKILEDNLKYTIRVGADFPSEYRDILIHKIIPALEMVSQHLAILCIYEGADDAAFDAFVNLYLDKAASIANKKPGVLIKLLGISLNIYPGADKTMLENMEKACNEKLSAIKSKIAKAIPLMVEKNYSKKFVSLLQNEAAATRNKKLSAELEKHIAQAKAEYDRKAQGSLFGQIKRLFISKDEGGN